MDRRLSTSSRTARIMYLANSNMEEKYNEDKTRDIECPASKNTNEDERQISNEYSVEVPNENRARNYESNSRETEIFCEDNERILRETTETECTFREPTMNEDGSQIPQECTVEVPNANREINYESNLRDREILSEDNEKIRREATETECSFREQNINEDGSQIPQDNAITNGFETVINEPKPKEKSNIQDDILMLYDSSDDGDFGSSSSDNYICDTNESSSTDDEETPPKRAKTVTRRENIRIEESDSNQSSQLPQENALVNSAGCSFWASNGFNSAGKKRKPRKSEKERRVERVKRTLFRNTGVEYTTKTGKTKKGRELRDLNNCRQKCKDRLPLHLRKELFDTYWKLGSREKRCEYIARCIQINKKKTAKPSPRKRRTVTFTYYVYDSNLQQHPICKNCLLKTFDESHRFLQTICEKLRNFGHLPRTRRSGKSIPDIKLQEIKNHIASFPCSESHYGRKKTTKKFLNSELNVQVLYNLYKLKTQEPVSKTIFKKVFDSMNLSFKKPSVDTCSKCDKLTMKLKYAVGEQAAALERTLKEHQIAFKAAYEEKRADKQLAQSCDDIMVITFDLQQCLPTPFLQTNVAFYKRQLWTYNLTIHDVKTNKAFCYMWPECDGNRGANEIASCLYDFIINQLPLLNANAKRLVMYSDSCPGQNKNSIIATMLLLAVKLSPQLTSIEHKFLIPGHTHMEADSDHALIERKKKQTRMDIHLPRDWYQLVRTASNNTAKFNVIEMSYIMFFNFAGFSKQYLSMKKNNENNEKFLWLHVRCLKYVKGNYPCFSYKKEFSDDEFITMDYTKRGKVYDMVTINAVQKAYHTKIPISTEKKKDLLQLLQFLHESAHEFYRSLSCKCDVKDTAAYDDDSSEEES